MRLHALLVVVFIVISCISEQVVAHVLVVVVVPVVVKLRRRYGQLVERVRLGVCPLRFFDAGMLDVFCFRLTWERVGGSCWIVYSAVGEEFGCELWLRAERVGLCAGGLDCVGHRVEGTIFKSSQDRIHPCWALQGRRVNWSSSKRACDVGEESPSDNSLPHRKVRPYIGLKLPTVLVITPPAFFLPRRTTRFSFLPTRLD